MPPDASQRRRARQACTHCNARRVKCNVTESCPCDNCIAAGTQCQLRVSRRGKHPRHRPGQAPNHQSQLKRQSESQSPPPPPSQILPLPPPPPSYHRQPRVPNETATYTPVGAASSPDDLPSLVSKSELTSPNDDEMSQASHALASLSREVRQTSKPDSKPEDKQEFGASIFFGESSSIRYIGGDNFASSVASIDLLPSRAVAQRPWQLERDDGVMAALKARPDGAFALPPRHVTTSLLKAYFQWFHPFCPIVDEQDIWHQFETGSLSTLLLQSLLFIATAHCDDSVLVDGCLGDRTDAKAKFHSRARDLYDADAEYQSIVVMQSLLLMSFWRGSVSQEKDSRYWIGAAISAAQRRGLHRSRKQGKYAPDARVPDRQKKLARRVWWTIYMLERQTGATLGLPQRIRDEDCDVEPLEAADFELAFSASRTNEEISDTINYVIGITQLAKFLGKALECNYVPNKASTKADRSKLRDELVQWKQNLPAALRMDEDLGTQSGLHTSMIHMAYNNIIMLLYRNRVVGLEFDAEGQHALQAAARTTRIVEDMLPRGILRHTQIHVITNLSNTLCLCAMELRASKGMARTIAEHRAKVCLLGLHELQRTWEFRSWMLQLFFRDRDGPGGGGSGQHGGQQSGEHESKKAALRSGTQLQASYGAAMPRDPSSAMANMGLGDFEGISLNLAGDMGALNWPVDEMERFLFSQIYDSNPFW